MADLAKERMVGAQFKGAKEQLDQVFHILRQSYLDRIVTSKFEEAEEREECYRLIQALNEIDHTFTLIIASGELSAAEIERLTKIQSGEIKDVH